MTHAIRARFGRIALVLSLAAGHVEVRAQTGSCVGFEAPDPPVIVEGKGPHHLGVNTHCLPAGTIIEKAEPWIHFGDASNTIDVQLPPGPVHLSLQIGDGEHRTLDEEGLCAMINLTVVEGGESSEG